MQSQTTIIRNTVNDIDETMQSVTKQAEVVDDSITHERITEMQSNFILTINLLSIEVENLVDIVNYATLGHIHSSIMSPKIITQQISDIKSKLPPNSEFPLEITTNSISDFFKLATVTVISVDDTLIFSVEIPVTNGIRFMIYEVIPLPMQLTQDQVIVIEAESAYLAVDKTQKKSSVFIDFFPNIPLNVIPINFKNTGGVERRHISTNKGIQYNFKNLARHAGDLKSLQEQINVELNSNNNQQRHTYTTTTDYLSNTFQCSIRIPLIVNIVKKDIQTNEALIVTPNAIKMKLH
ncbi:uncharacterized protein LOC132943958 [Metopolophium dirhodum]|uniref:uncharacterized protein LOC132943958 n=1 Tax=Metopolophium dirhodum TaxID=44670 RepID=UPI00299013CB|nr:uncharacterized protein LOC132943958 [Metopolophium dirhodum]